MFGFTTANGLLSFQAAGVSLVLPFDIVIALVLIVTVIITTFVNKSFMVSLLFAFYPAILIYNYINLDLFKFVGIGSTFLLASLFIVIATFLIAYFLFKSIVEPEISRSKVAILDIVLLSIASFLLVFTTIFHIIPTEEGREITSSFAVLFEQSRLVAIFFTAPLVLTYFSTR